MKPENNPVVENITIDDVDIKFCDSYKSTHDYL